MIQNKLMNNDGFTLIEAMLSVVLLGLIAYGISGLYFSGMKSIDEQLDRMLLDSHLRGRMEILIGNDFSQVIDGSGNVSVNDKDYTITWTATLVDMDGDSLPESDAKLVTVSVSELSGRSVSCLIVDNKGMAGKI